VGEKVLFLGGEDAVKGHDRRGGKFAGRPTWKTWAQLYARLGSKKGGHSGLAETFQEKEEGLVVGEKGKKGGTTPPLLRTLKKDFF